MTSYDSSAASNDTSSFASPSFLSSESSSSEGGSEILYIILALASPIAYGFVNVVDKTAVSMRVKHTPSYLVMIGVVDMIVALIIAACCDWSEEAMKDTSPMDFVIPVISAICWAASIYCYYIGMLLADASVIVGVEYMYPLVVVILSAIFLHERIQAMGYVGCVLLVIGASTLSLNLVGLICKKCKSARAHQEENKERSLVLGNGYGPFQQALIPAGSVASITNAGSTAEARAAFSAILNWRGDFVMPIMEKPKMKKIDDSYVDIEAGCAPGVSCWFPCATWCSNCQKVVGTKSEKKEDKKKKDKTESTEEPEREGDEDGSGKKKKIDSRKSLESTRNVRVRRASVAAVNATVNRPTPEYDTVVGAEKKEEEEKKEEDDKKEKQEESSTGVAVVAEEKKDMEEHGHHHHSSSHHHRPSSSHHHSSSRHHHPSSSHHHHSSSRHHSHGHSHSHSHSKHRHSTVEKQQLHSDEEDEEEDEGVEDEEKLDDDAIPLEDVGRDKKKVEEEEDSDEGSDEDSDEESDEDDDEDDDDDDDDDDEDEEEELSDDEDEDEDEDDDDGKKKKKKKSVGPDGEEKNCITSIVAWCNKHKDSKGLLFMALVPLIIFLALTEFLAKVATAKLNTFNVCSINFFAFGFCMFGIIFVTPFKGAKYFVSEVKRNWLFCILSDLLTLTGQFLLIFAMSGMSASVVSSLAAIQPFCTLCLERVFGIASDSLKECLTYKLIPVILIVAGVVLLSVAVI